MRQWSAEKVAFDQNGLAPLLLDQGSDLAGVFLLIEIGDQDVGPFARESDGDRPADAAVAASDDCALALQSAGALVARLAVVGRGSIFAVEPMLWSTGATIMASFLAFPFVVRVSVWCIRFPVTAELRSATSGTLPAPCSVGLVFCLDLVCLDFIVWTSSFGLGETLE